MMSPDIYCVRCDKNHANAADCRAPVSTYPTTAAMRGAIEAAQRQYECMRDGTSCPPLQSNPQCGVEYPLWRRDGDAMVAVTQEWVDYAQSLIVAQDKDMRALEREVTRLENLLNDAPSADAMDWKDRVGAHKAEVAKLKYLLYGVPPEGLQWTQEEFAEVLLNQHYANALPASVRGGFSDPEVEEMRSDHYNNHAWECLRASARG